MATTRSRWLLPAAAAVVIAVVAFATCRSDETPPEPSVAPPPVAEKTPAPRKSRRGAETSTPPKTARGGADSAASANGSVPEDDGFPFVDVEVVKHDGSWASNAAIVYALPAGTTTKVEPPNENLEDGRCRLHVMRAGKYDIGAVDDAFAALAEDVEVPREGPLRITLPEPAALLLVGEPPLVPDDPGWLGVEFRARADGERLASWPGRGQEIDWSVEGRVEQGTKRIDVVVPKGAAGRVLFGSVDVDVMPGRFTAPATLHLVRAGRYPLTLRLAFESPGASFPRLAELRATFFVGEVGSNTAEWSASLAANQQVSTLPTWLMKIYAAANEPDGTITWKGNGIAPGSQPFSGLARDTENVVDLTLRLASDAPAPDADAPPERGLFDTMIHLRAAAGDDADLPSIVRLFFTDTTGYRISTEQKPGEDIPMTGPGDSWLVATRGGWTTEPVRVAAGPHADGSTLTLRPGGWLVVALERRPPRSLGPVVIRKKDGAPFLTQDGAMILFAADAEQGAVLGPLPAGAVDFVLELSGEAVRELRANVRAGAREKLVIPSLAPR